MSASVLLKYQKRVEERRYHARLATLDSLYGYYYKFFCNSPEELNLTRAFVCIMDCAK